MIEKLKTTIKGLIVLSILSVITLIIFLFIILIFTYIPYPFNFILMFSSLILLVAYFIGCGINGIS